MTPVLPVSVHGFTWTAGLMVVLNLLVGGGLWAAVIGVWPKLKTITAKARQDDMEGLRGEIATLREEIAAQRLIATAAGEKAHKSEMIVVTVVAAFQLAMGELEKLDPNNKVLKQARDMMAIAMTGDFGMDQSLHRLAATATTEGKINGKA